jgi:hypothetical protein
VLKPIETSELTAADVDELTRTTQELMLKEVVEMARDKRSDPMLEKTLDSATQNQETITAEKDDAVAEELCFGVEASPDAAHGKRTSKL